MVFGRSQGILGGDPEGIRNIYAKFSLPTNFFQITVQIYCTIHTVHKENL